MPRPIRMFEPGKLYFITNRTLEGRLFMTPSPRVNDVIGSTLARALRRFRVRLYGAVFLGNHYHLLIQADPAAIPRFIQYLQSVIARKVNRLIGRRGPFWERRYSAEVVEDRASAERLMEYIFAHGVKEGLVERGRQWPGVHTVEALLGERTLTFTWEDWTERHQRALRGERVRNADCVRRETLRLTKLPWLAHLTNGAYRTHMAALYCTATSNARAARGNKPALGRAKVLTQSPRVRPRCVNRSRRPTCHASTKGARLEYRERYREFRTAYDVASEQFRRGRLRVRFPAHAFLPPGWLVAAKPSKRRAA